MPDCPDGRQLPGQRRAQALHLLGIWVGRAGAPFSWKLSMGLSSGSGSSSSCQAESCQALVGPCCVAGQGGVDCGLHRPASSVRTQQWA